MNLKNIMNGLDTIPTLTVILSEKPEGIRLNKTMLNTIADGVLFGLQVANKVKQANCQQQNLQMPKNNHLYRFDINDYSQMF